MLTYLRYALATICFAASVGCLAWLCHSIGNSSRVEGPITGTDLYIVVRSHVGSAEAYFLPLVGDELDKHWHVQSDYLGWDARAVLSYFAGNVVSDEQGHFAVLHGNAIYFPIWYPALIFALAGVGVLRFRRQFSIRSALVAVSVVAALLGMAVVL